MRARQKNLRPALFAANVIDIGAGAITGPENFARDHFVTPYRRLAASEIDDHIAKFHPLHDAVDDIADPVLVLLILPVALGFADLLNDHLLGRLRGDPPEIERRQGFRDPIAGLRRRVFLARLVDRDLSGVVLDLIDDEEQAGKPDLSGFWIDFGANLGLLTVAGPRGFLNGVLHRGENDLPIDRFFPRDGIGDLQEFEPIGADCHLCLLFRAKRRRTGAAATLWLA